MENNRLITAEEARKALAEIAAVKSVASLLLDKFINQAEHQRDVTLEEVASMFDRLAHENLQFVNRVRFNPDFPKTSEKPFEEEAMWAMKQATNIRRLKTAYTDNIIKPSINIKA